MRVLCDGVAGSTRAIWTSRAPLAAAYGGTTLCDRSPTSLLRPAKQERRRAFGKVSPNANTETQGTHSHNRAWVERQSIKCSGRGSFQNQ